MFEWWVIFCARNCAKARAGKENPAAEGGSFPMPSIDSGGLGLYPSPCSAGLGYSLMLKTRQSAAQVVELVDALASGASGRKVVEVRVLSWAPFLYRPREGSLIGLWTHDPPSEVRK